MAGLPLKSGADFYNLEAARMRLHNLGADPTEVGAGLIYFNTSTGLNTSQKARLYTGSAWKTIAFSEDLDVASNADFLALKERVDLLSGDVDTDAIISNMKEVSAFLEGFAEDASLMDLLNGKLNTSGGTINGNLLIGAPNNTSYRYLQFARSGYGSRLNIADGDLYVSFGGIDANGGLTATKVFSLGNNGIRYASDGKTYHDILTSAGGTISGILNMDNSIVMKGATETASKGIFFGTTAEAEKFRIRIASNKLCINDNEILHSGNIGSYKAGDADKLGGLEASGYAKNIKNLQSDLADIDIAFLNGIYGGKLQGAAGTFPTTDGGYQNGAFLSFGWVGYGVQISSRRHNTWLRTVENSAYSAWKQIAFTDSNVASATKLETARTIWGQSFDGTQNIYGSLFLPNASAIYFKDTNATDRIAITLNNGNGFSVGFGMALAGYDTSVLGNCVYLKYGKSATAGLILNSSGNVTIGGSDLAGTSRKLFVSGGSAFFVNTQSNITTTDQLDRTKTFTISAANDDAYNYGLHVWIDPSGRSNLQSSYAGLAANKSTYSIALNPLGGNVLIGTTTDNGGKLQVDGSVSIGTKNGSNSYLKLFRRDSGDGGLLFHESNTMTWQIVDTTSDGALSFYDYKSNKYIAKLHSDGATITGDLHVTGNIIADGEVSAGGAAEEGGNAGGGGAFHSEGIDRGLTQKTIAHGLGTDDIVVSIYEKDGVSGRWSIILTDVEIVDANNIIVSFGSATSVEHKVVIMGAVA